MCLCVFEKNIFCMYVMNLYCKKKKLMTFLEGKEFLRTKITAGFYFNSANARTIILMKICLLTNVHILF